MSSDNRVQRTPRPRNFASETPYIPAEKIRIGPKPTKLKQKAVNREISMRMERSLARQIACDVLNPHIDTVLKPTEEDESYEIGATLKNIEKKNPEEINDIVRVIVKKSTDAGYDTSIDPPGILRCNIVGDLVDEIRNSSSK